MPAETIGYYRVSPFAILSVYRRGPATVNLRQKTSPTGKTCEIWFVQSGSVTLLRNETEEIHETGAVFSFIRNTDLEKISARISPDGVILGSSLGEYIQSLSDEEVVDWNPSQRELLLPDRVDDPDTTEKIGIILQRILAQARSTDPLRFLKNRADFSEFLLLITEYCSNVARARLKLEFGSERHYCDLACTYVKEHLAEPIRVSDVASSIGISYSYLHKLFARHMEMPLVEYINRERILLVKQLIYDYNITLEEAGMSVGIHDTKYLSRLFHRYVGMSVTEYRRAHK